MIVHITKMRVCNTLTNDNIGQERTEQNNHPQNYSFKDLEEIEPTFKIVFNLHI